MAAGCELMSGVEKHKRRETERGKAAGGGQGDEKTEGVSQDFMMYCRRGSEHLMEMAAAAKQSCRANMVPLETFERNMADYYG